MIALRVLAFLAGLWLVVQALISAVRIFVLPRSERDPVGNLVFVALRKLFDLRLKKIRDYRARDRILAWYAPTGLMLLVPSLYLIILSGYTLMFWASGGSSLYVAFRESGSSLFTLGFEPVTGLGMSVLTFSEALIGLVLVALLIAYLPTIYAAFSRREAAVTLLESRAGDPPSVEKMLLRYTRIHGLERLSVEWERWETWFADIQESHTSLAALVFFRSPLPQHSWLTAAGAVLDTASFYQAAVDRPTDPAAALCIRGGYLALRALADYFEISYDPHPLPSDPISIPRAEFDELLDRLAAGGVPLKADREQAWRDFSGWRVNYDTVLRALAELTDAPLAKWSSDHTRRNIGIEKR